MNGLLSSPRAINQSVAAATELMITSVKRYGSYIRSDPNDCFASDTDEYTIVKESILGFSAKEYYETRCSIPADWIELPLIEVAKYNHDTSIFTFQLSIGCKNLSLPVGGFLLVAVPNLVDGGYDIRKISSFEAALDYRRSLTCFVCVWFCRSIYLHRRRRVD